MLPSSRVLVLTQVEAEGLCVHFLALTFLEGLGAESSTDSDERQGAVMDTPPETYLQHLRSLPYDDFFRDGDVPLGYECGAGTYCGSSHTADYHSDRLYCLCDVR